MVYVVCVSCRVCRVSCVCRVCGVCCVVCVVLCVVRVCVVCVSCVSCATSVPPAAMTCEMTDGKGCKKSKDFEVQKRTSAKHSLRKPSRTNRVNFDDF